MKVVVFCIASGLGGVREVWAITKSRTTAVY